jgi:hypothetical protein
MKKREPLETVRERAPEEQVPGQISSSRVVPAAVPSLFQTS